MAGWKGKGIPAHLRFALLFAAGLSVGLALLLTPPVQVLDGWFSAVLVKFAHALILLLGGRASVQGAVLRAGGGFAVQMEDGCNGVNVTILLWSAILAFPAGWKMKAAGLAAGSLVIQILNVVRFITLFYLGQYSMPWFEFAHAYVWESLLILATLVVFGIWTNRVSQHRGLSRGTG